MLKMSQTDKHSEPVWPSGKVLGWWTGTHWFESASALLSLQKLWSVDTVLWLLSLTINGTLKSLSPLPILMQESFWWWQCSDRYIISLSPHLYTPFPPSSPSLISLVVSVDIKHLFYSLPILMQESFWWWQCSNRYIISPSTHLHTPFPPSSLSLISLVVSVDIKHLFYSLPILMQESFWWWQWSNRYIISLFPTPLHGLSPHLLPVPNKPDGFWDVKHHVYSLPILMQESFWWWQCSNRYITSLFPTPLHGLSPHLLPVPNQPDGFSGC